VLTQGVCEQKFCEGNMGKERDIMCRDPAHL
jgi:hypothetical protein